MMRPLALGRLERIGDVAGDIEEADAARQKGLDGDFVGGAEDRRGRAAAAQGLARNG